MRIRHTGGAALLGALVAACGTRGPSGAPPLAALDTVDVGAGPGSTWPSLATDGAGQLVVSWLEPVPGAEPARHRLRFVARGGAGWSAPRTIVDTADLLVNWADFPTVVPLGGARLAAWWPQVNRRARASEGYDAIVSTSADRGATWTAGVPLHGDGTPTEHGFVSFVPLGAGDGSVGAVWLDGRAFARPGGAEREMQLAVATVGADGRPAGERMLDSAVCTCCRTSAARTRRGVLVSYRDHKPGDVRDIAVARYENGAWAPPATLHEDGWVFPGCPVNGSVAASHGDTVAVAWFSAPNDSARVSVAFSTDGGRTFGAPTRVDDGTPAGRAGVAVDASGAAIVTWIERVAPSRVSWFAAERQAKGGAVGGSELRARRVALDGARGPAQTLVVSTEGRASGFPQLAAVGDTVYLAWTDPAAGGAPPRVRVARTTLRR